MAEAQPPGFLQAAGKLHPANLYRRAIGGIVSQGVGNFTAHDLIVTAGPGAFQVSVDRGIGYITGTDSQDQGAYTVYNDASKAITLNNPGGSDRYDAVIAWIKDDTEGQAGDTWVLDKVTGTSSPTGYIASLPNSCMVLAVVKVRTGAGSILNSDITDARTQALSAIFPKIPNARVNKTGLDQSLPTNLETAVTWDTMEFDTDGFYSGGATDRLTVPVGLGGRYLVVVNVAIDAWNNDTSERRGLKIWRGSIGGSLQAHTQRSQSSESSQKTFSSTYGEVFNMSTVCALADNDYVTISAFQDTGHTLHIASVAGETNLSIIKIG